ncbi:uncharacterized protein LOC110033928 [Phalaenopsis equestris]|uniref:uncharacterized protein LOC110033928 n=1 Tax=Phalaenopsis equestris TaxID=78828 RepID=UPI0009E38702|nr:uncharacterized protein LOC110033928 [Phalaenopsis equestris]
MESFRPQRSVGSDRFLAPFYPQNAGDVVGVELDEDELFSTGIESPEPEYPPRLQPSPTNLNSNHSRSPIFLSRSTRDGFQERNFGILAALPEEETKIHLVQRKPSISLSSSPSTSPSPSSSSARLIPSIPTPRSDFSLSVLGGKIYHQSAPVNVPVAPQRLRKAAVNLNKGERVADAVDDDDDDEMLPPHEIVARASGRISPLTTFSVLEGAGRTLKGRDLRRVRNAVWRETGFLD